MKRRKIIFGGKEKNDFLEKKMLLIVWVFRLAVCSAFFCKHIFFLSLVSTFSNDGVGILPIHQDFGTKFSEISRKFHPKIQQTRCHKKLHRFSKHCFALKIHRKIFTTYGHITTNLSLFSRLIAAHFFARGALASVCILTLVNPII